MRVCAFCGNTMHFAGISNRKTMHKECGDYKNWLARTKIRRVKTNAAYERALMYAHRDELAKRIDREKSIAKAVAQAKVIKKKVKRRGLE
jgi:hypothetical protein